MSDWKPPAVSDIAMDMNTQMALIDARDIIRELGQQITVQLFEESTVERDKFNSVKKKDLTTTPGITFYAFPIIYNPTDKQLEDSGMREKTHVLIKTAVLDWTDNDFTVDTLKAINSIRANIIIKGAKYEIVTKQLDSQYRETYLYIHLGLNRV